MTMYVGFPIYLVLNLITFAAFGWDKRQATLNRWRTPEATLLLLAAVGGSVGALCGMSVFHHKTKKLAFALGVPMITGAHMILLSFFNLQ